MNLPAQRKIPQTPAMHKEWRRYCVIRAIECRRLGSEWKEAKRDALMCSMLAKEILRGSDHVA